MPRVKSIIRRRFTEGTEVLCSEIEETLLRGEGLLGTALELRTLDDWKLWWTKWRKTIMAKSLEHRPGSRPVACYVTGEIPLRPVLSEPPLSNGYLKLYVPARDGTGVWLRDYPEPFMQAEVDYLFDLGVVDAAELKRHRASLRKPSPYKGPYRLSDYVLEQGLFT
jgi:hypothetical protein